MRNILFLIILISALAIPFISIADWEWGFRMGEGGIDIWVWLNNGVRGDPPPGEFPPPGAPSGAIGQGMRFTSAGCFPRHDLSDYPVCGGEVWPGFWTEYTDCCLIDKVLTIGDYIFVILLVVAVIIFLLAAWGFLTSQGEPEKVKKSRDYLIYALVGIAVAFLAKALVRVVASIMT